MGLFFLGIGIGVVGTVIFFICVGLNGVRSDLRKIAEARRKELEEHDQEPPRPRPDPGGGYG
jgi:hypothetical protein